ncbi:MAG: succinate dehydrogenase cytochrome b558 subunit [Planctomycetes bacterium]|nr:succinate dehydrogenase cytochrome b558 subunit [Planctomycetota bacterium]
MNNSAASVFGQNEFVLRRWHSLTGLLPIGGFLCFHLATNASILDGPELFQRRVGQIHSLGATTLVPLEWAFSFLPILFHGVIGLIIVSRGKRNVRLYPYAANWRYTLQRWTGAIAFPFILWHVLHMHGWFHFPWWTEHVALPLGGARFDPENVLTAATAIQASPLVFAIYLVGVLACVYHFTHGLWTMGITWGVWTSPRSQRTANILILGFGCIVALMGLGALAGMQAQDTAAGSAQTAPAAPLEEGR